MAYATQPDEFSDFLNDDYPAASSYLEDMNPSFLDFFGMPSAFCSDEAESAASIAHGFDPTLQRVAQSSDIDLNHNTPTLNQEPTSKMQLDVLLETGQNFDFSFGPHESMQETLNYDWLDGVSFHLMSADKDTEHVPLEPESSQTRSFTQPKTRKDKRRKGSQHSGEGDKSKKKPRRTIITAQARERLQATFTQNPYPSDGELVLLSGVVGLPVQVIKIWFNNYRARHSPSNDHDPTSEDICAQKLDNRAVDLPLSISRRVNPFEDSAQQDRLSPAPSACSLERFLAAPSTEDPVPITVIEAAVQNSEGRPVHDETYDDAQSGQIERYQVEAEPTVAELMIQKPLLSPNHSADIGPKEHDDIQFATRLPPDETDKKPGCAGIHDDEDDCAPDSVEWSTQEDVWLTQPQKMQERLVPISGEMLGSDPSCLETTENVPALDPRPVPDLPYRCNLTGCEGLKGFTYDGDLLRHEREVHNMYGGPQKPLFCPFPDCKRASGTGFTRKENLAEHIRRVHRRRDNVADYSMPPSPRPRRAFSTAGSISSMGSINSVRSFSSQISIDSRGSRKGRKRWTQTPVRRPTSPTPWSEFIQADLRKTKSIANHVEVDASKAENLYFCTWPGCSSTFRYRSEWTRHEEAIHYCPYSWICCLDTPPVLRLPQCFVCGDRDVLLSHIIQSHFDDCAKKGEAQRTFGREDQLAQHIKRVHCDSGKKKISVPKEILASWKIDNPTLCPTFLKCGFCGRTFDTWALRQEHVSRRLHRGIRTSAWWPERCAATFPTFPMYVQNKFTCANCGRSFPDFISAMQEHALCQTWSCRYLYDYHSVFNLRSCQESDTGVRSNHCKLCDYRGPMLDQADETTHLKHAETHALRSCEQLIFHNLEDFTKHMMHKHGLAENFEVDSSESCWDSLPWAQEQHLEILEGRHQLRISQPWIEDKLCQSRYGGYIDIFLDQDKRG